MPSFFGRANFEDNDDFTKDLRMLGALKVKKIQEISLLLKDWLIDDSVEDSNELVEKIAVKLNLKFRDAQRVTSITKFLFNLFRPDGDAYSDDSKILAQDLASAKVIENEQVNHFIGAFNSIRNSIGEDYLKVADEAKFRAEGIPRIVGITSTVNLRAVVRNKYNFGDDLSDYQPDITGLVPIATLKLRSTEDSPTEHFFCQIDKKSLHQLILHFQAIEKEFDVLENYNHEKRD